MNELIIIKKEEAQDFFTNEEKVKQTLETIKNQVLPLAFDVYTDKGRKEIASAAFRVAKCKTYIDAAGKDLVDELKELPKLIDKNRKAAREFLENLKEEVRKPLTLWEEEQARKAAEEKARKEAEELAKQVEADFEIAIVLNAEFDRKKAEEALRIQKEREERERAIAESAAKQAREEAEARAAAEALVAKEEARKVLEAQELAAMRAILEAQDRAAEVQRQLQAKIDEQKRSAAEAAAQELAAKLEREALQKKAEEAARSSDVENKKRVHNEILLGLVEHAGLTEELAKAVIVAMAKGLVANIKIIY